MMEVGIIQDGVGMGGRGGYEFEDIVEERFHNGIVE